MMKCYDFKNAARFIGYASTLTACLLFSACSQTPLQKLASNEVNPDLNTAFWSKEQDHNTQLWKDALAFCKKHLEKPNCPVVMELFTITNGSTQAPTIGHSGQSLEVPNF